MKNENEKLIEKFIKHAVIQGECTYSGDYKRGNRSSKTLFEICDKMKENRKIAISMIDEIINHKDSNVLIWICGVALDIGYRKDEAEKILTQLANDKKLGILGFNAELSLKTRLGKDFV